MGKAHDKRFRAPDGSVIVLPVAKRRGISNGAKRRAELFHAQKGRCYICNGRMTMKHDQPNTCTVDHFVPLSRDGNHGKKNLRGACFDCNQDRGNTMPTAMNF